MGLKRMKHNQKTESSVMRGARVASAVIAAVFALFGVAFSEDGIAEWKPGTPMPNNPHVIAAQEPGRYVPEPGWRFVSDAADDYSVVPLEAKEVIIPADSDDVVIPAPKGFWSSDSVPFIKEILRMEAEADQHNKTVGQWARTRSGSWDDIQQAAVKIPNGIVGKTFSLSTFGSLRNEVQKNMAEIAGRAKTEVDKTVTEMSPRISAEAERAAGTNLNLNLSVGDIKFLPPHLDERDRWGYTLVRTDIHTIDGRASISYGVNSCALIWIRGKVAYLWISNHADSESEVETVVTDTREMMRKWLADVDAANRRTSLEAEDVIACSNQDCINVNRGENRSRESLAVSGGKQAEAVFSLLVRGLGIDLLATLFVLGLVHLVSRKNGAASTGRPIPMPIKFVVAWLFTTCATGLVAALLPSTGPVVWLFVVPVLLLKPLFAVAILKRHVWPRRFCLVCGILSLLVGIVERMTTPSGVWNGTAVTSVFNGMLLLIIYALLISNTAEAWRTGSGENGKANDGTVSNGAEEP